MAKAQSRRIAAAAAAKSIASSSAPPVKAEVIAVESSSSSSIADEGTGSGTKATAAAAAPKSKEELLRGTPKSGRTWKVTRTEPAGALKRTAKGLRTAWEKRKEAELTEQRAKLLHKELLAEKSAAIENQKQMAKERRLRKEENERKAILMANQNVNSKKMKRIRKKISRKVGANRAG